VSISTVPTADPVSQTIEWRLELSAEAAKNLLPGQQVRVRFAGGQAERMLVPGRAVLRRGELTAVYVASGTGFVLKAVRLGADHGAEGVEVVAGLSAGDRVALEPVKAGLAGAQAVAPAPGAK
jgi:multidrug efflux pump subunit AcrA (membrane-fusion protein)